MKLTLSGYAKKHNVSRELVRQWILAGRIRAAHPADGVWLIDSDEQRPAPKRPWADKKAARISLAKRS